MGGYNEFRQLIHSNGPQVRRLTLYLAGRTKETMLQPAFLHFSSLCGIPDLAHAIIAKPCNLAPHTGPELALAVPRRRQVCGALGLDFERLTCPQQVHGTNVARVDAGNAGAGRLGRDLAIPDCDGVMTDLAGVPLVAFSADCCLLVIVEPAVHAVGLTHAGWRGVAGGGASVLVARLREAYGADPARMIAAIAPAARPCCYEISADLAGELAASPSLRPRRCRQPRRQVVPGHADRAGGPAGA